MTGATPIEWPGVNCHEAYGAIISCIKSTPSRPLPHIRLYGPDVGLKLAQALAAGI
jgi:hypothetical protein